MRPFYSLITPCHNSKDISILFDSLTRQGVRKEDLEIIAVDDNSTDKHYIDVIKSYDFNVIFAETNTETHCPGNTRREGMKYATGSWLCFADHDDYFEDGSLGYVKGAIESVNDRTIYEIITGIYYRGEDGKVLWEDKCTNSWLHGKFYSMDKLIKPYGINFKEDLVANEDCYFNCQVFNQLIEMEKDFDLLDISTYNWIAHPESLSNKLTSDKDRGYIFEHFNDFIYAVTEPYMKNAAETKDDRFIRHVISGLLFAYFYYEAADYYSDIANFKDCYFMILSLINRIGEEIGLSKTDIANYVYQDTNFYYKTLEDSFRVIGPFIPRVSLQDFILNEPSLDFLLG